jgi:hypothetical protein
LGGHWRHIELQTPEEGNVPICKDPSITFLNRFGYNVIKLPRVGIEPMDIIGRDKTTEWLGPLSLVWKSAESAPKPRAPQPAADVQGQQSEKLELSVGLKVLENALRAFGASVPSLNFAYNRAKKVQFAFTSVTSTVVPPLEAGNYLASGDLNTNNPLVSRYFLEDEAQAYLVFDVLKTDSITVTATDSKGAEIKVDVPQIQSVVGAEVGVKTGGESESSITYKGKTPVSFGFRAFAINFVNGRWALEGAQPSGALAFAAGAAAGSTEIDLSSAEPVLLNAGGFLNMR